MNEHLNLWLDAYLDGELTPHQRSQVEDHLASCPHCQALLERRRSLSSLLLTAPPAAVRKPAMQFVAEVSLQARRQPHYSPVSVTPAAISLRLFQFSPLILLLGWAFIQSWSIVTFLLALIPGAGQILAEDISGLGAASALSWLNESSFSGLSLANLDFFLPLNLLSWNWITSLLILAASALIYLGWLASWWALARQGYKIENS